MLNSNFTGASINAVTKSGTNSFSGTAYTYHKPRGFAGSSIDGEDILKAKEYNSHSYGVTFGGPIIKNKLFFFLNAEIENKETPGVTWLPNQDQNGTGDSGNVSHVLGWVICVLSVTLLKLNMIMTPDSMRTSIISKVVIGS